MTTVLPVPGRSARVVALLLFAASLSSIPAAAQDQQPYEPVPGQEGKDVVWVPSPESTIELMLDQAGVTARDFVMDLGSGDGRTIIAAARRGAHALGVEYNPSLVEYSRDRAAQAGVADLAKFEQGDMYEADISKATVLALFLLPSNLDRLLPKFLALPPGTRIVANTFWVRDWTPEDVRTADNCGGWCTSQLFIIPAAAEGKWSSAAGVLSLTQKFQMVEGTYTPAGGTPQAAKGRLRGSTVDLMLDTVEYEGTVKGSTIQIAPKAAGPAPALTFTRTQ